jgi:hypothetical protein
VQTRLQILSIIVSGGLFLAVFELVRRRRLQERYALLWLFSMAILLGLSVWSDALNRLSKAAGVLYGPSALFAVTLAFVIALLLHFSLVISRLAEQNKMLAQRLALLQAKVDGMPAANEQQDERPPTAA